MVEQLETFQRRLEKHLPNLSKSQRHIAEYLQTNYDQAAFLSAAELAQRLDVSEATVVRFAQAIGYAGFPELKRCLQDLYRDQVTPATRLQHKLAELASQQGHVLNKIIDMEVQYLNEAARTVSLSEFDRAVEIILNGKRVFVRGGGPSAVLADLMELRLRRFGIFALSITELGRDLIEKLQLLQPDDVVIATGFHHVSPELATTVEYAHMIGCRTVLITDTLGAAFHGKADVVLAARRGPVSTFHSLTVPMAIVNALILAVAMARHDASLAALDHMQQMRSAYGFDEPGQVSP